MTLNALRQEYGTRLMLKSIAIMLALPYAVSLLFVPIRTLAVLAVIGWIGKEQSYLVKCRTLWKSAFIFAIIKATRGT